MLHESELFEGDFEAEQESLLTNNNKQEKPGQKN